MMASQKGHVEVVDKLLQHGARIDLLAEVHFIVRTAIFIVDASTLYIPRISTYRMDGIH